MTSPEDVRRYKVPAWVKTFRMPLPPPVRLVDREDDLLNDVHTKYCEVELQEPLTWHRCSAHNVIIERA